MIHQESPQNRDLSWLARQIKLAPLRLRARYWRWNEDSEIPPFMGFAVAGITVIYALVLQKSIGVI